MVIMIMMVVIMMMMVIIMKLVIMMTAYCVYCLHLDSLLLPLLSQLILDNR